MAFPTTLHISRPYILCAPGRSRGPGGGVGLSPCRGLGEGGGGAGLGGGERGEGGGPRWPWRTAARCLHT